MTIPGSWREPEFTPEALRTHFGLTDAELMRMQKSVDNSGVVELDFVTFPDLGADKLEKSELQCVEWMGVPRSDDKSERVGREKEEEV